MVFELADSSMDYHVGEIAPGETVDRPGWAWTPEERIPATMLRWIAAQVSADPGDIESYAKRDPTRREHILELLQEYSWRSFGLHEYREMSAWLMNQARSTDLGMALITLLISELRNRRIVVPVHQ
jgi:hypothetical protein